jgi:hypothetical protein
MARPSKAVIVIHQVLNQFARPIPLVRREAHARRVCVEPVPGFYEDSLHGLRIGAFQSIEQGGKKLFKQVGRIRPPILRNSVGTV